MRREGFTLIELLIVMSIIAVLISIAIPAVMKAREASNRTTCQNNLRQFGVAFQAHHQALGYFPTAGVNDLAVPTFDANGNPFSGFRQDAGWGYQVLPYMDAEPIWTGGSATTVSARMTNAISTRVKYYFCPSRRAPVQTTYKNPSFPIETTAPNNYGPSGFNLQNTAITVVLGDYAGCNGSGLTTNTALYDNGVVVSQANGRNTVTSTAITDGLGFTLMMGEKAANPLAQAALTNEDDVGYFSGFSGKPGTGNGSVAGANFNAVRLTGLAPYRDIDVTVATGGAFGSAHFGTWNALFADASVHPLSYQIDPVTFASLGTIKGNEIIDDNSLQD